MTTLSDLFSAADLIGNKYQSDEERQAYAAELYEVNADIDILIDERNEEIAAKEEYSPKGSFAAIWDALAETADIKLEPHQAFMVEQSIRSCDGNGIIRPIEKTGKGKIADLLRWSEINALEDNLNL